MLKAIIIDDEPKGRNILQQLLLNHCPAIHVLALAANADEGLKLIDLYKPHVIFLDVEMPGKSGFDLLREAGTIDFKIVFVTAFNHYTLKAIKFHAFDYLLKPVDLDELKQTVEKLQQSTEQPKEKILVSLLQQTRQGTASFGKIAIASLNEIDLVEVDDILYLEASGTSTFVYLSNGKRVTATRNLKEYDDLLNNQFFFRIHHAYLVNLRHISKYIKGEGGSVIISNKTELEVSRRRKAAFLEVLSGYRVS
ncbi:MAG: LytTR family DNA-binding domain-containing protein [Chitinophagaceae bacterium]